MVNGRGKFKDSTKIVEGACSKSSESTLQYSDKCFKIIQDENDRYIKYIGYKWYTTPASVNAGLENIDDQEWLEDLINVLVSMTSHGDVTKQGAGQSTRWYKADWTNTQNVMFKTSVS